MSSLSNIIPAPSHKIFDREEEDKRKKQQDQDTKSKQLVAVSRAVPPYPFRRNSGWVPRNADDFGDGGAYPEIHVAQFPLGMGLHIHDPSKKQSNALQAHVDSGGKLRFDALANQGHAEGRVVHANVNALLPKRIEDDDPTLRRPSEDEITDTTQRTREALERLTTAKIAAAMPVKCAQERGADQYIRYTAAQQGESFNSGAQQRIIRLVEAQRDPLSPPRFSLNKKIPRGPPSPPAPVLHSPPRRLTAKEQADWKIPPCISNWKNAKGFTIPLDKRLAADGRGLQAVHVNENFAKFSEALFIAERNARSAVEMRSTIAKKIAEKEKEKREEYLRTVAKQARDARFGNPASSSNPASKPGADQRDHPATTGRGESEERGRRSRSSSESLSRSGSPIEEVNDETSRQERDRLRKERERERQRDRNLARAAPGTRTRLQKEKERDVSEQIALGTANVKANASSFEAQFDTRLFNQQRGIDSGFEGGEDEAYNVYDAAWRTDRNAASAIYRPSRAANAATSYNDELEKLAETRRFTSSTATEPSKNERSREPPPTSGKRQQFAGADRDRSGLGGPVQFTRGETFTLNADTVANAGDDDDPFGLTKFLQEAKSTSKRPHDSSRPESSGSSNKRDKR